MQDNPADKRGGNRDARVLVGVYALKLRRPIDGDVAVDRHTDDDVDRAGHEGVDERQL